VKAPRDEGEVGEVDVRVEVIVVGRRNLRLVYEVLAAHQNPLAVVVEVVLSDDVCVGVVHGAHRHDLMVPNPRGQQALRHQMNLLLFDPAARRRKDVPGLGLPG